jgi:hypothetical protein
LASYPSTIFGNHPRRFNPKWYKDYPWIDYFVETDEAVCFACREFGQGQDFTFKNWQHPHNLAKHSVS